MLLFTLHRFLIKRFLYIDEHPWNPGNGCASNHRERRCCVAIATIDRLVSNFLVVFPRLKLRSQIIGKLIIEEKHLMTE